tara:strand:+ start:1660 stop:2199 length:540 start_codon:yes stop_codon:yes gene_type:complete
VRIIHFNEPWQHFEVYDFISYNEHKEIKKLFKTFPDPRSTNDRISHKIENEMLRERFKELLRLLNVEWNENKHSIHMELDKISPKFKFQIHTDIWTKVLSLIIHISETGHGTRLYSPHKSFDEWRTLVRTMNWTPRGGGGFLRTDETYHSFDTIEDNMMRQTILLTLRQNKNWMTGEDN